MFDIAINFKGGYTVGEWMWLWYETYSKPNIPAATQDNYENYIRNHIEPGLGHYSAGFTLDTCTHVTVVHRLCGRIAQQSAQH